MKYVNLQNFENIELETQPFDHVVIDNFMKDEYINEFLVELEKLKPEHSYFIGPAKVANTNLGVDDVEYTKKAFKENLGDFIDSIFKELYSEEFIEKIEKITGVNDIIRNNIPLEGAGIHKVYNEGFLLMHEDFNHTHDEKNGLLYRRINLLLYMNPEWKEEYNGHLLLYDRNLHQVTKKILPILNRCVIFKTPSSIHGHPEPLKIPEDISRQALALYYYTKDTNGLTDREKELSRVTWYHGIR